MVEPFAEYVLERSFQVSGELLISSKTNSVFRSGFVNFHIGPEGTEFTVHAQPLARLSQPLNMLIYGKMLEATTGVIDWKDTDEETFIRFCEFAYVKNYTPPKFSECTRVEEPKQAETPDFPFITSIPKRIIKKKPGTSCANKVIGWPSHDQESSTLPEMKDNKTRRRQLMSQLHNLFSENDYPPPSSNLTFYQQFDPVSNTSPHQDFTPVLVGHAQLYVLADKYDVRELKSLVLHKLYTTLEKFTLCEARIADVMELVRFAYDNTPPSPQPSAAPSAVFQAANNITTASGGSNCKEKKVDGLRKLVTRFVVSKLDAVAESDAFLDLLHYGGDFVKDFWSVLWNSNAWVA
ncbi:hypothetical protein V8E54_004111 [Elaphomyces granulatus]